LELLCRGIVQRNYGRFGQLRSRRQQPGVEFHLKLHTDCDLGAAGNWFGWQCRWYELPKDHSLGGRRRAEIVNAIEKAKADIEELTDFVLCLRELPRKRDLDWYFGLERDLRLHLWADEEIEPRLTGDAEVLRQTYFGELILTRNQLAEAQARAVEPLKQRWVPQLHVTTAVEEALLIGLSRPRSAQRLQEQAARIAELVEELRTGQDGIIGDDLRTRCESVATALAVLSERLIAVAKASNEYRPQESRDLIAAKASPSISVREVRELARRLRVQRIPVARRLPRRLRPRSATPWSCLPSIVG
jgi:hypothetical protein